MLYRNLLRNRDSWLELDRIHNEIDQVFNRPIRYNAGTFPAINIWTNPEAAIVTTELPGFTSNDIQLSITGSELTLKGSRKISDLKEDECFHRQERFQGKFERVVQLPFVVDLEKIDANMKNGILTVKLMRHETDRPKNIEIKTS